jgi:hypothetical protein
LKKNARNILFLFLIFFVFVLSFSSSFGRALADSAPVPSGAFPASYLTVVSTHKSATDETCGIIIQWGNPNYSGSKYKSEDSSFVINIYDTSTSPATHLPIIADPNYDATGSGAKETYTVSDYDGIICGHPLSIQVDTRNYDNNDKEITIGTVKDSFTNATPTVTQNPNSATGVCAPQGLTAEIVREASTVITGIAAQTISYNVTLHWQMDKTKMGAGQPCPPQDNITFKVDGGASWFSGDWDSKFDSGNLLGASTNDNPTPVSGSHTFTVSVLGADGTTVFGSAQVSVDPNGASSVTSTNPNGATNETSGSATIDACDSQCPGWLKDPIQKVICEALCSVIDWISKALGKAFDTLVLPNLL